MSQSERVQYNHVIWCMRIFLGESEWWHSEVNHLLSCLLLQGCSFSRLVYAILYAPNSILIIVMKWWRILITNTSLVTAGISFNYVHMYTPWIYILIVFVEVYHLMKLLSLSLRNRSQLLVTFLEKVNFTLIILMFFVREEYLILISLGGYWVLGRGRGGGLISMAMSFTLWEQEK